MKKVFLLSLFALLLGSMIWAQASELPQRRRDLQPTSLKINRYYVANLELMSLGLYAWSIPFPAKSHIHQFWPAWFTGSFEAGLGPKLSLVAGGSFRHCQIKWSDFPNSYNFRNSRLDGFKALLGLRFYMGKGGGQGFFLQPTAKLVSNHFFEYSSDYQGVETFRDYFFSLRFGLQKHLNKHLVVAGSIGPELGYRGFNRMDLWPTFGIWNSRMSELDYASVPVIDSYGRQWISIYLTGDANLSIGWKF